MASKTKKQKIASTFPDSLIKNWENSDGVNFAIPLAGKEGNEFLKTLSDLRPSLPK